MSNILEKLRNRLAIKTTNEKETYAILIRRAGADAPKDGDEELLAATVESLNISLDQVERDIAAYATFAKLADNANALEKNRAAHKAAHENLVAFEKRKTTVLADLAAEGQQLESAKAQAHGRMASSESARTRRAELEKNNPAIFAPNTVKFEELVAE